jgi:hypothetical protein
MAVTVEIVEVEEGAEGPARTKPRDEEESERKTSIQNLHNPSSEGLFQGGKGMNEERKQKNEEGFTLVILLVVMVTIGGLVTAHLGEVRSDQRKIMTRIYASRAQERAFGELERAKNIVNASPYFNDQNTALKAAVLSSPPYIPGTEVAVEKVGGPTSEWYTLKASGEFMGITRRAQIFVRQRSPVSAFNFFVVDHPLGISGAPRGAIHSNKTVDFYFPWGTFRDQVTASEGFNFKAGATPVNTRLWGQNDAHAPKQNIMDGISVTDLKSKPTTLKVVDNLVAEIRFLGKNTQVKLFQPAFQKQVQKTGQKWVFDKMVTETWTEQVEVNRTEFYNVTEDVFKDTVQTWTEQKKVYRDVQENYQKTQNVYTDITETYTVQEPIYEKKWVTIQQIEKVWVENPPPSLKDIEGGFSVGGQQAATGHWENISKNTQVLRDILVGHKPVVKTRTKKVKTGTQVVTKTRTVQVFDHFVNVQKSKVVKVKIGTKVVQKSRQVFDHYKTVTKSRNVPKYRQEAYQYMDWVNVAEKLARTQVVPTKGVLYFEKMIRKIQGKVEGQVSVASNDRVQITDSIQYHDANNNTRMLNGLDKTKRYQFNPAYRGKSILGIMSRNDITYSRNIPASIEINASLISTEGKVSMEGISVNNDGTQVGISNSAAAHPNLYVKDSIRRLGGIVSRKRPVATYVDSSNNVGCGFKEGVSIMDRNMILKNGGNISPPYVFQMNRPTWTLNNTGPSISPN